MPSENRRRRSLRSVHMWWDLLRASPAATSLAEQALSLAESSGATQESAALRAVVRAARSHVRQATMPSLAAEEIELPLVAARLARLAYERVNGGRTFDRAAVAHDIIGILGAGAQLLHFQPGSSGWEARGGADGSRAARQSPQWFLARAPAGSVFPDARGGRPLLLVFRGTDSLADAERDLCATAVPHGDLGARFHAGFLEGVRDDTALHDALEFYVGADHLYLIGHSLGGALALTMLGADLLPGAHRGATTVIALGAPKCLLGSLGARASSARVLSIVHDADLVPRLPGPASPHRWITPPQQELVLLRGSTALAVPRGDADGVLAVEQSVRLRATRAYSDHSPAAYVDALAAAKNSAAERAAAEQRDGTGSEPQQFAAG